MKNFKNLNQYEYLGLVSLLKKAYPFIEEMTCGTCYNGLKEIQNTETLNAPNYQYSSLGAFGLSEGLDVILQFYNEDEDEFKLFYITFRDLKDWEVQDGEEFRQFLKEYEQIA